tara:strand:- start:314 stop:508 length:195 start_codon:yes stop_codon:yes gene_type:complete
MKGLKKIKYLKLEDWLVKFSDGDDFKLHITKSEDSLHIIYALHNKTVNEVYIFNEKEKEIKSGI